MVRRWWRRYNGEWSDGGREIERGEKGFFFFFFVVREIEREGGVGVGGCLGSLLGEVLISTYEAAVVCKLSSSFKF